MTALGLHMETHQTSHGFPKREMFFNCASSLESWKCLQCPHFKTFKLVHLKQHFKDHTLSENEDRFYACESCIYRTHSNFLFLTHKLSDQCETVWKTKPGIGNLASKSGVRRNRTDQRRWRRCQHCSYLTKYTSHLKRHILSKHTNPDDIQWFKCEHCSYKCKTKSNLKLHVHYMHSRKDDLKCDHCQFETKIKCDLQGHISARHPERIQWFECEHCSYKTQTKRNLTRHSDYKHGTKTILKCDHCTYETKVKGNLKNHVLIKHTDPDDVQWFHCAHCAYKSRRKVYLQRHFIWHPDHAKSEKYSSSL